MVITDASPIQDWIRAFDAWDQAQRRFDAAGRTGSKELIAHLATDLEVARRYLDAAQGNLNV